MSLIHVFHLNWEVAQASHPETFFKAIASGDPDAVLALWQEGGYAEVAQLEIPDLERDLEDGLDVAYRVTNSIERDWTNNPEIHRLLVKQARSTSIGDVLLTEDSAYVVAVAGFTPVAVQAPLGA